MQKAEDSRGAGGSQLIQVLREHGLSRVAAQSVVTVGTSLRERTRRREVEFAAMLEASSGVTVGPILGGASDRVDVRIHLRAMRGDRRYVQIHSHPASTAFSNADALVLARYQIIQVSCVVGLDGTWYILSRRAAAVLHEPLVIYASYRAASMSAVARYRRQVRSGVFTPAQADRALSHEVWERIAPELGLRYDRVE